MRRLRITEETKDGISGNILGWKIIDFLTADIISIGNYDIKLGISYSVLSMYRYEYECCPNLNILRAYTIIIITENDSCRFKLRYSIFDKEKMSMNKKIEFSEIDRFRYMTNDGVDVSKIEFMAYGRFMKLFLKGLPGKKNEQV